MRAAWWWIDRWRKSTAYTDMNAEQQGVYRNLLDELWLRDGVIPADERILAKIGGDQEAWPRVRDVVLARFVRAEGGLRHETHDEIARQQKAFTNRQRERGRSRAENAARGRDGKFQPAGRSPPAEPAGQPAGEPATRPPSPELPTQSPPGGRALLLRVAEIRTTSTDARTIHDAIIAEMRLQGWQADREVFVENRGDGRSGRLDVFAICGTETIAIEIDRCTPRDKSLAKLKSVDATFRAVVLRSPTSDFAGVREFDGVAIIGLKCQSIETRPEQRLIPVEQIVSKEDRLKREAQQIQADVMAVVGAVAGRATEAVEQETQSALGGQTEAQENGKRLYGLARLRQMIKEEEARRSAVNGGT